MRAGVKYGARKHIREHIVISYRVSNAILIIKPRLSHVCIASLPLNLAVVKPNAAYFSEAVITAK